MTIKTFPIQFTEEKLEQIRRKAESEGKSIKQFILELIETALNKED